VEAHRLLKDALGVAGQQSLHELQDLGGPLPPAITLQQAVGIKVKERCRKQDVVYKLVQ